MTNWQDKYKDLKVGEWAWYWHKSGEFWSPIYVFSKRSIDDGKTPTCYYDNLNKVSERCPNGPRCLTPEEIEKLLSPKEEVELPNAEVYQDLEDSIVGESCGICGPFSRMDNIHPCAKDLFGMTAEERKEVYEFAMKRSDEILRGKKDSVFGEELGTNHCTCSCGRYDIHVCDFGKIKVGEQEEEIKEKPYVLGSCGYKGCRGFTKRVDQNYCSLCEAKIKKSIEGKVSIKWD